MSDYVDMTIQEFDTLIEKLLEINGENFMKKSEIYFIDEMLVRAHEPTASDKQRAIAIRDRYT